MNSRSTPRDATIFNTKSMAPVINQTEKQINRETPIFETTPRNSRAREPIPMNQEEDDDIQILTPTNTMNNSVNNAPIINKNTLEKNNHHASLHSSSNYQINSLNNNLSAPSSLHNNNSSHHKPQQERQPSKLVETVLNTTKNIPSNNAEGSPIIKLPTSVSHSNVTNETIPVYVSEKEVEEVPVIPIIPVSNQIPFVQNSGNKTKIKVPKIKVVEPSDSLYFEEEEPWIKISEIIESKTRPINNMDELIVHTQKSVPYVVQESFESPMSIGNFFPL